MEELNNRLEHLRQKEQKTQELVSDILQTDEDKDIDLSEYGLEPEDILNYFKRLGDV